MAGLPRDMPCDLFNCTASLDEVRSAVLTLAGSRRVLLSKWLPRVRVCACSRVRLVSVQLVALVSNWTLINQPGSRVCPPCRIHRCACTSVRCRLLSHLSRDWLSLLQPSYSNVGFTFIGRFLEAVSGQ